jgi:hypothetical protein
MHDTFLKNLLVGTGVIMFWSSIWGMLDAYFLVNLVPHPVANNLLRVAAGLALIFAPDGDVKELGGVEDEEEDEGEDGNEQAAESSDKTTETVATASERSELLKSVNEKELSVIISEAIAASQSPDHVRKMTADSFSSMSLSLDAVAALFDDADSDGNGQLSAAEFLAHVDGLANRTRAAERKAVRIAAAEAAQAALDERNLLLQADLLAQKHFGFSPQLSSKMCTNVILGVGIATVWSGIENLMDLCFASKWGGASLRRVPLFVHYTLRIALAFGIIFACRGSLNDVGDGWLEEEDDEDSEESVASARAQAMIASALLQDRLGHDATWTRATIDKHDIKRLYEQSDKDKNGRLSAKELAAMVLSMQK